MYNILNWYSTIFLTMLDRVLVFGIYDRFRTDFGRIWFSFLILKQVFRFWTDIKYLFHFLLLLGQKNPYFPRLCATNMTSTTAKDSLDVESNIVTHNIWRKDLDDLADVLNLEVSNFFTFDVSQNRWFWRIFVFL